MKWINADAARDIFEPLVIKVHDAELTSAFTHTLIFRSNVPSIDIVFCKECCIRGTEDCSMAWWNSDLRQYEYCNSDNDYCSFGLRDGERREP